MKRFTCAVVTAALAGALFPIATYADETDVQITEDTFPDEIFRSLVLQRYDTDSDDVLSQDEIAAVTVMDVRGLGIEDLAGIEYFTALNELDCSENGLHVLDLSNNNALEKLVCEGNECEVDPLRIIPDVDRDRMSNIVGGKIALFGGIVIQYLAQEGEPVSNRISYDYDCGNGFTASFAFVRPSANTPDNNGGGGDSTKKDDEGDTGKTDNGANKPSEQVPASDAASGQNKPDVQSSPEVKRQKTTAAQNTLKAPKIKLKAKKRKIVISWTKVKGATGYRIYTSKRKSGQYKLVKTIKRGRSGSYSIKAKKGKKLYVKVRAYKRGKGGSISGKMSKVRSARAR